MNSKTLIRKALSLCLVVTVYAAYSMVAFASSEKVAGELLISGKDSSVRVNGEAAQNGRTIFSASSISTPENSTAIIDLGKIGKLQLAPNTTINVAFTDKAISGDLMTGRVTVLGSAEAVSIKTTEGKTVKLNAGESVSAGLPDDKDYRDSNGNCVDADKDGKLECDDAKVGGLVWWGWTAILGGAVAAVVIAATTDNNRIALGGGTTVVSPSR
ncbi:MAG: hypothetical protein JSS81_01950 [Acidobacteria bacterium]|nr:hypothetical protein [Acidobacteriota bacterium]